MAQVKVCDLWVRIEKEGPDAFRLQIGKKIFGRIIGVKSTFSRRGIEQAMQILRDGSGAMRVGDDTIEVRCHGENRVLKARGKEAELTPAEVSRILAMARGVVTV